MDGFNKLIDYMNMDESTNCVMGNKVLRVPDPESMVPAAWQRLPNALYFSPVDRLPTPDGSVTGVPLFAACRTVGTIASTPKTYAGGPAAPIA
ncbi:hypothetical protein [Burkholderia cepacia]|uniref:hypothetical protein n=1 Tax=Burkholderia cepacia TaxID=292 RepID=UPI0012D94289|nr:hypothetical protein [Burkholderia cepacia]